MTTKVVPRGIATSKTISLHSLIALARAGVCPEQCARLPLLRSRKPGQPRLISLHTIRPGTVDCIPPGKGDLRLRRSVVIGHFSKSDSTGQARRGVVNLDVRAQSGMLRHFIDCVLDRSGSVISHAHLGIPVVWLLHIRFATYSVCKGDGKRGPCQSVVRFEKSHDSTFAHGYIYNIDTQTDSWG